MEIYGDLWRSMEIYGDLWWSMEPKTNKKVPGPGLETQSPLSWNFNWDSMAPDGANRRIDCGVGWWVSHRIGFDGKILTGNPDQFDGKNHGFSGRFSQQNQSICWCCWSILILRHGDPNRSTGRSTSNVVMEQNQGIPNTPKCILNPGVNFFKNSTRYYHMSRFRNPPSCQMFGMNWYMIHGSRFTKNFWCRFHLNHFALGLRCIWAYSIPINIDL